MFADKRLTKLQNTNVTGILVNFRQWKNFKFTSSYVSRKCIELRKTIFSNVRQYTDLNFLGDYGFVRKKSYALALCMYIPN